MKDFYFSNEDDEKDFLKNKKWLIHSLIIDGVKKSFEENLDSIVVFRIINPISNFVMTSEIKKEDWLDSLSKSMEYYESVEEYEKCTEIKELIKNIKDDFDRSDKGKNKTKKVIESCVSKEHYEVAKRMLERYNNKFEDFVGYNELKRLINQNKDGIK
jgi:hypothetical protein